MKVEHHDFDTCVEAEEWIADKTEGLIVSEEDIRVISIETIACNKKDVVRVWVKYLYS